MIDDAFRATWSPRLLSVLRIIAGLLFLQHGLSKFFGFPAPSPATFQVYGLLGAAGAIEIVGGVMVAVGLFTRSVAFICSGQMAFAYFWAHAPRGFFPQANTGELAIFFCFVFLYIALEGGGPWSVDAARKRT
ncbi:MAG: DoxX family protein [Acetobacteraceae bacterium]|nr:DoxX family protein [Acetobacteraceae bacterium]